MNNYDAAKVLGISDSLTPDLIKQAYRRACMKYHPDRNPAGSEMMILVNEAYDVLKDFTGDLDTKQGSNYGDLLNDALNAIITLPDIEIEVCGSWVWLSGDTKTHKVIIKEAGYKWSPKKSMWYFRPAGFKSYGRGKYSMDEIRTKYGSASVASLRNQQIKAA